MNTSDIRRNLPMLKGPLAAEGYDWWWHNFTGYERETGEQKNFFIEYFMCNPARGETQPVLGQLPENRAAGRRPSYVMIKAGHWGPGARQFHNFYGIRSSSWKERVLELRAGDCILEETKMSGRCSVSEQEAEEHPEFMSDAGTMSWDLQIDKQIAYHVGYGASAFFRLINSFEMFWHAEGIKTAYAGQVTLDGTIYDIIPERSFGYADKNWGKDFTSPWLWISSCDLTSTITGKHLENSAIEFGGGNPKVFGVSLGRKLLGGLYYEGTMYEYNFSRFWTGTHITFNFTEGEQYHRWEVHAKNRDSRIELVVRCAIDEMLLINYEAPNGKRLHNRLWNGGTGQGEIRLYRNERHSEVLVDHLTMKNTGCEYGTYDS